MQYLPTTLLLAAAATASAANGLGGPDVNAPSYNRIGLSADFTSKYSGRAVDANFSVALGDTVFLAGQTSLYGRLDGYDSTLTGVGLGFRFRPTQSSALHVELGELHIQYANTIGIQSAFLGLGYRIRVAPSVEIDTGIRQFFADGPAAVDQTSLSLAALFFLTNSFSLDLNLGKDFKGDKSTHYGLGLTYHY